MFFLLLMNNIISRVIFSLLQRGSMFVFSMHQFRALIDFDTKFGAIKLDNLLGDYN